MLAPTLAAMAPFKVVGLCKDDVALGAAVEIFRV